MSRRACDNPFAVHRVLAQRYRFSEEGWSALGRRFEELNRRAAIIGEHGRGKTTLLEDFSERLAARGWSIAWLRLNCDRRDPSPLPRLDSGTILVCDGAEQLGWLQWMRLRHAARAAGGVLSTTHAPGWLPTLHRCVSTPELLQEIVGALDASVPAARCDQLFRAHGGNLREAIRELYDDWAGPTPISVACGRIQPAASRPRQRELRSPLPAGD